MNGRRDYTGTTTVATVPDGPRTTCRAPPAASMRSAWECRPMWPLARLRARAPSSMPVPSSVTANVSGGGVEGQRHRCSARAGVADDVAQQLADRAEQQVVDRSAHTVRPAAELDVDGEVVTAGAGGEVADRLGQTDAVEDSRVQLGHGRAEHARRFREGVVDAGERPRVIAVADVFQVVAGGEQVLQGAVVQSFREHLALTLLDVHEVVEEAGAVAHELSDRTDQRQRSMRERPIDTIPTLARSTVFITIEPLGSPLASCVAQLASR